MGGATGGDFIYESIEAMLDALHSAGVPFNYLAEAFEWVFDWPEGDQDRMFQGGQNWRDLAEAIGTVNDDLAETVPNAVGGWSGEARENFDEMWGKVQGGEEAALYKLVEAASKIGEMMNNGGLEIESSKFEIAFEFWGFVIGGIIVAIVNWWNGSVGPTSAYVGTAGPITRGAIQVVINFLRGRLATAAAKAAAKATLKKFALHVGREMIQESLQELATKLTIDQLQRNDGNRQGFDWQGTLESAWAGAWGGAGGAFGAGLFKGRWAQGIAGEVFGESAGQLSMGQVPTLEDLARNAVRGGLDTAVTDPNTGQSGLGMLGNLGLSGLGSLAGGLGINIPGVSPTHAGGPGMGGSPGGAPSGAT
ncbi:MAG: hypothetical protein ACRDJ9_30000, partial [Dehalococcoidia bacterium]